MAKKVLTYNLSEPLSGATAAKIDINTKDGNLTIDGLTGGEQVLASGTLQYTEKQGMPTRSVTTSSGQATLAVKSGGGLQPWFHFPWDACNGATEWQIHLNPGLPSDITAHSGGGNVRLDLDGMAITSLWADTGGGNMEVVLPDNIANLNVTVKSGAGNVVVSLPKGIAARITAATGMGKVIMDPRFSKIDDKTYQSPDYEGAANTVELTLKSGAGNVTVKEKAGKPEAVAA